jgi:anaerobic ribonucleoside-triphosphate reductase activating protein
MVHLSDLLAAIDLRAHHADGLTVSGGEPFDQSEALAMILKHWRMRSKGSVIVFTGREFEELSGWLQENPGFIDAVVSGPFRADLPQTLAMRGSDNQRLHILSEIGRELLEFDRPAGPMDRRLDIMFDENGYAWMAGIPARGDIAQLRRVLGAAGHRVVTSAEREVPPE